MPVTASDLYDYIQCPHRVTMDIVGDPSERDPVSGEARTSIGRYLEFYNARRPHSSLDGATPDRAYFRNEQHAIRLAA